MVSGKGRSVKPVLDLTDPDVLTTAVDAHDPPDWMRDAAILREATCVFPGCTRDTRRCACPEEPRDEASRRDVDHRVAYLDPDDGGPPGQTHLDNLGSLCRHHHRLKTHHHWSRTRLAENTYAWTTPDRTVLHSRTHRRRH